MAGTCPVSGPDDPLVRSLLGTVDCNVQSLVRGGYGALFQPQSAFATVLTSLLTFYVALIGYRLLLGRGQLRITDLALTAVKLGAVLALATQWGTYQAVVYDLLFQGPEDLANAMLVAVQPDGSVFKGDVFDGLQKAFDALTVFSASYAQHAPPQASPLMGGAAFGAFALTIAASTLLLCSLGVLLAAKIVLGLLLAVGPLFIALMLFDSTRGLFQGWMRASLAFAFVPLATILLLGVMLTMLEPSLLQLEGLREQNVATLAPVYSVLILVLVFVAVSAGGVVAGAMIAGGLTVTGERESEPLPEGRNTVERTSQTVAVQPRAARIAAAVTALERRDNAVFGSDTLRSDRRTMISSVIERAPSEPVSETRLGQAPRRSARPRIGRAGERARP
jgi:type IV secretion system protein VirB6